MRCSVPVPSSPAALRARGRDHVRELARRAADELRAAGLAAPRSHAVLVRRGRVRDSAGLAAHERRANLAGSFAVRGRPPSGLLVVVDDVVTSGATLTEAAAALAAARPDGAPRCSPPSSRRPRGGPTTALPRATWEFAVTVRVKTPDRLSDRRATD